nr:ABC transporter ATP-binding protein [Treponema sp.]
GERQRIGLARAFLYDAKFMLLDEPTSNLDSLNEAVILKSLKDEKEKDSEKTMLLVSHRKSTLSSADGLIELIKKGR